MSQKITNYGLLKDGDRFRFLYDEEVLVRIGNCRYIIENSSDCRVFYIPDATPVIHLPEDEEDK